MTVGLNSALVTALVKSHGGVTKLLRSWGNAYGEDEVPDKQSIYHWRAGKLPRTSISIIRLADLLDVDPLCLLAPKDSSTAAAIGDIFHSYQTDVSTAPALQFLEAFFGWKSLWPPAYWENERRNRSSQRHTFTWHTEKFEHDPNIKANYYPTIELASNSKLIAAKPQTFHFAYSGTGAVQERWLQFGFVVRHQEEVSLVHIHGHTDACRALSIEAPTLVETWFGPGPAIFRVASRHSFSLTVSENGQGEKVRFLG